MAGAILSKQLTVETQNKLGMFAEVTGTISGAGVNIVAICAYGMGDKAVFYVVTNNNASAQTALKKKGMAVKEEDVVTVMLDDTIGTAKAMADKIKAAGIDLGYIYGSACGCVDTKALLVMKAKDNAKLIKAING